MRLVPFAADSDRFAAVIENLCFKFHKWDAYLNGKLHVLTDALVLTSEEHAHAVDCCVKINAALGRAESIVRENTDLMERIAIARNLHPIIRAETASHRQIARYDLFPTAPPLKQRERIRIYKDIQLKRSFLRRPEFWVIHPGQYSIGSVGLKRTVLPVWLTPIDQEGLESLIHSKSKS